MTRPSKRWHSRSIERCSQSASLMSGAIEEVADAKRHHLQIGELSVGRVKLDDVHEDEVATIGFVVLDALIVVQEVAAAVKYRLSSINLDRLGVVRGVAVNDVDIGRLDGAAGKGPVAVIDTIAPVFSPMHRNHHDVALRPVASDPGGDRFDGSR